MFEHTQLEGLLDYDENSRTLTINGDGRDFDIEANLLRFGISSLLIGYDDPAEHVVIANPVRLHGNASDLFSTEPVFGLDDYDYGFTDAGMASTGVISHDCTVDGCENLDVSDVFSMMGMFKGISGDDFNPDVSEWNVSNVEDMRSMFSGCSGKNFNVDVSKWDTGHVLYMDEMFEGCSGRDFNPDISQWDISSLESCSFMFFDCHGDAFNPNFDMWNFPQITNPWDMLYGCVGKGFDIENFITTCDNELPYDTAIMLMGGTTDDGNVVADNWRAMVMNDFERVRDIGYVASLLTRQNTVLNVEVLELEPGVDEACVVWHDDDTYGSGERMMGLTELQCRDFIGYQMATKRGELPEAVFGKDITPVEVPGRKEDENINPDADFGI